MSQNGSRSHNPTTSHDGTIGNDNSYAYMHYNGSGSYYGHNLYSPTINLPSDNVGITVSFDTLQDWYINCNDYMKLYIIDEDGAEHEIRSWDCDYSNGGSGKYLVFQ